MSYAHTRSKRIANLGDYAARILKGEKPASLPILQPTRSSSSSTSRREGPWPHDSPSVLALADEVIE